MSRCGKTTKLEAWVDGELNDSESTALQLHVEHCVVCLHEHRWLSAEKALFNQRAEREQARPQWSRFEKAPSRKKLWAMAGAVAAGWVLFALAQWAPSRAAQVAAASTEA
ncbi:MAG: zf-HC2 domain-containing protein, partial [Myxococcaceae bacterium]|nr:zf-HC2 domain-containing protein [Myxococcaceae bacterium]